MAAKKKAPGLPAGPKVLCLRTSAADGKALAPEARGFQWPAKGLVGAPDWSPAKSCGNGLHGLLKGEGDADMLSKEKDALWQVVEVLASEVVDLSGKVKFPRCTVTYSGTRDEAVRLIQEAYPSGACVYGTATAGTSGTATAGYSGTATAGDYGTATAGTSGTATAGYSGTATAGELGIINVSYWDGKRRRIVVGYIGEDGLLPNTPYKLNEQHKFVVAK